MTTTDWVPDWARRVVWYQIFPERFRNGDPGNDPTVADQAGSWPHDPTSPWQVHPWTSDWYALQPYERANGRNIWFNLQRRRYGGDLQGILDQLDYLQDLGVTALYLNPVFWAPSSHKYDGATYHHIDPTFGPDPAGDDALIARETPDDPRTWVWTAADRLACRLIGEVHRRGMYIIFDGVFNHMGLNSFAFRDVVANQQHSRFADWFEIRRWADPARGTAFDYQGWAGVKELPDLRKVGEDIAPGPKAYIFAATRRWMDPNGDGSPDDGIDGWRLDVAFCVGHQFWKDWRGLVKSINPQAYLTAEVIDPIDVLRPYLLGDEFDAVMNYNFAFACVEYFVEEKGRISTTEFDAYLHTLREAFPGGVSYVMQNLVDSHDSNRIASHIVNRNKHCFRSWTDYHIWSSGQNPAYDTRAPGATERQVQKLLAIFQMTYLGAPMIYYGDEAGMWGANDPCCRKPMVWDDMTFAPEVISPRGVVYPEAHPVAFDHDLFAHYRQLIHIRNAHPALQVGDFQTLLADDAQLVYAFARTTREQTVVVVLNNHDTAQSVTIQLPAACTWHDVLNHQPVNPAADGSLTVEVPAKWGRILV